MPILGIDTINKEKTLPNTDNADSLLFSKRSFDSYTIELCNSSGHQHPSFCYPEFENKNGGESGSYGSTIYSKAGSVSACT